MGAKFYFFTDPGRLDTQTDQQAFGPAGASAGKDQFRITDVHSRKSGSTAAVPVFAVCDGILCAQEDGQGTLTLILKPSQAPPFESPVVSYFIYKGIDKNSLLSGDQILDENASGATPFTQKIAAEWKNQNQKSLTDSRAALGLDRAASFTHDDGTKIFTDNDAIDRLFTYPHKTVQLPTVAAGDEIGSFQGRCGFEVVLHRLAYAPKLALARTLENYISVPSLAAGPWLADDAAFFAHWHEKEQVLAFMDPCAYFGSFVQAALYQKSGSSSSTVKGSDIYQEILQTFSNKNIAWLDIRNNYSYSYNLFGLYDDTIRFVSHSDASQTKDKNFRSNSWPILRLQIADVPGSKKRSLYRTKLRLPVGKSSAPAVLLSKGFVTTLGPEKPRYKTPAIAADSAEPAFYQPIRLAFPLADDGGQEVFSCSYTRVNIYEMIHGDPQPGVPLNISAKEFLDGVFRPRDLRLDTDYAGNGLRFNIYPEEVLVDLGSEYGPAYASFVGVAQDANNINLFAFPHYALPNGMWRGGSAALSTWADMSAGDGTDFLTKLASTFRPVNLTKKTINSDTLSAQIDTIIVRNRLTPDYNPVTDRNSMPDFCFIVLSKSDYQQLGDQISAATGLNPSLPAFLTVGGSQEKTDAASNVSYVEKNLQATGYGLPSLSKVQIFAAPLTQRIFRNADF